ncbi:sugar hydrolase [Lactococcus fujiensis JCM 16395]|uniref:Sugar hydrolase n=2 Tax=Lactococcus fujiensis TaxID=610251 RepID=A0A2A5RNU3_9LACT|nr:sugar hydrolase [Lactococcus fujiensis JCM 16395]
MAYEQHHMRLVNLLDDLLDLFKKDPEFDSFHLDGQTIILDDYLQVRPEREDEIRAAISSGKLRIGPFYILQDDFLISSESNVRNMLIGKKATDFWGQKVPLGYFPDTFGNMGQTPQLMKGAGLENVAFGRGVKPIGFDNQVLEQKTYSSQYSEMWWQGPDESEILGILFANWYSNGNEIPTEKDKAISFWTKKIADAEKFASTPHILMMNGGDHQPVQKDLSKAIRLANELFPEYEFIHSNWPTYLDAVRATLPEDLSKVSGELTSQETDGWYTLANTASSRVYLKQKNTLVERKLENIAEPLATLAYKISGQYPHEKLLYAWKILLQNHPHDSICGCSLDSVHREMMTRFEKAETVADYVLTDALETISKAIQPNGEHSFVVFNTSAYDKTGEAEVEVVLERKLFSEGLPVDLYRSLDAKVDQKFEVIDQTGQIVHAEISKAEVLFDYDLPKDRFRVPYMKRFVKVKLFLNKMPAFSWQTFQLVSTDRSQTKEKGMISGQEIENSFFKLTIEKNGTLSIFDKVQNCNLSNILEFEDTGDIGNEYIYFQPQHSKAILSSESEATLTVITDQPEIAQIEIKQNMMIPESADALLEKEQQEVLEFRYRKANRSKHLVPLEIKTIVTVRPDSRKIDFETTIDNQMTNHRIRVLFPSGLTTESHEADSIFEVVKRPNQVSEQWENPTNPQHQQAFVNIHNADYGLTIGNFGLNEYEILNSSVIALTLVRSVGELGDWGYFPTPEAQTQGRLKFTYSLEMHDAPESRYQTYKNAYASQIPFSSVQLRHHDNVSILPNNGKIVDISADTFATTALKRREADDRIVLRGYNMSDQAEIVHIVGAFKELNLLEEEQDDFSQDLKPYEIKTILVHEMNNSSAQEEKQ